MTEKDYDKLKQIEEAIRSFNSKKLYESSLTLFKALDYQSNKTERISPNNFEGFIDSFNLPKNAINKDKAFVSHWKHIEFIFQVADSEITRVQSLFDTGEVDKNEYQSFLFFTIQLKEESYKRSELVKITRELNVPFKMPVIVLFHYGNKLTLSIIDRRLHKKDSSKDVLEKVTLIKDIDITNPQRAHKEILKDLSLNELYKKFEFHSFVKLHEAWKATLNISELNKKFYKELAYWYFWALQEVEFPDDELKDDKTRNPVNVIRLITRLIFVWFLKEKNLIPDDLFNKRELDKILDYKDKTGSTYYKAILQNLFFATLNTEMNKDVKDKNKISRTFVNRNTGVPHYFRYSRFIKDQDKFAKWMDNIPFLNGGLFECLDKRTKDKSIFIDGFTQQIKNETIVTVPDDLFFGAPRLVDLNSTFHTKGKKYEVQGLINILSRYKFTIEENTPVEEEVALDPELLGKVFENLLACYDDGDDISTRKLTGSFYTPREIVNYMVDESLITYLCNSLLKEDNEKKRKELNTRLHQLFSYNSEEPNFTDAEKVSLIDAIDNCKILDPACGSGAFPMGILHKLVFILGKLDPNNKRWKQKQQDKAKRDKALAQKMEDDKNRDAAIKEIDRRIEDIEKAFNQNNHELDFARKLYLIENCIYGVDKQPVAIQISKLRFFIALIVDQKTENDIEPNRGIRPLPNLETKFVAADTLKYLEKEHTTLFTNPEIEIKKNSLKKVRTDHFRVRTTNGKESLRQRDEILRNELSSLLVLNHELQPATAKKIANWNPYDQNSFAEFFDTEWMFEIDGGFDVILGNPPYVSANNMSIHDRNYYNASSDYQTLKGKWDLYIAFTERSLRLLNHKGVFSFIIPFGFLNQPFAEEIRKYILKDYSILSIVDLHNNKIFESATVPSCIPIIEKAKSKKHNVSILEFVDDNFTEKYTINIAKYHETNQNMFRTENLDLTSGLLDKIKSKGIQLDTQFYTSTGAEIHGKESRDKKGNTISGTSKFDVLINKFSKGLKPYIEGSSIEKSKDGRYSFPKIEAWLDYSKAEIMRSPKFKELFDSEKLIIRRSSGLLRILAIYDERKIYTSEKCLIIIPRDRLPKNASQFLPKTELELKYLIAILNSKLIDFYYASVYGGFIDVYPNNLKELPIANSELKKREPIIGLVSLLLFLKMQENRDTDNLMYCQYLDYVIDGCVYELYFGDEMKKAGVDILALVEKDLDSVKKLSPEKAIVKLYEKWQEPKNEVRNRLLLMSTRCPDTIGVIEASVS